MKKNTLLLFVAIIFNSVLNAQTLVAPNGSATLDGYIVAFNAADDSYAFDFPYPAAEMLTTQDALNNTITVAPNFAIWIAESNNPAWFNNPNTDPALASDPNKKIAGSSYVSVLKVDNPSYFTQDLIFSGDINSYDLLPEYTVTVFIRVFVGGFSSNREYSQTISSTDTSFSITAPGIDFTAADEIIQYGFTVNGLIANPAFLNTTGYNGVEFQETALSTEKISKIKFETYPNPTNDAWVIKTENQTIDTLTIYDVLGKAVLALTPNKSEVKVDATNLKTGLYFATIKTAQGINKIRLIKT